jgi:hypothetical protein
MADHQVLTGMVQKVSIKEQNLDEIGFIVIQKQIARTKFIAQYWKLAVF